MFEISLGSTEVAVKTVSAVNGGEPACDICFVSDISKLFTAFFSGLSEPIVELLPVSSVIVSPETKVPLTFDITIVEKLELSNATFSPAFAEPSVESKTIDRGQHQL